MAQISSEEIDRGIDRVLDFLDVQRGATDLPDVALPAHFASYEMDESAFAHLNEALKLKLFPEGQGAPESIANALHGGALLGVAIGLAIADARKERSR